MVAFLFLPLFFLALDACCAHAESVRLQLMSLRISADANRARIVVVFNRKPDYNMILLSRPARLVINLPAADFPAPKEKRRFHGFVKNARYGMISPERSRMIFSMKSAFKVEHVRGEPLHNEIWQLAIEVVKSSDHEFEKMLQSQQTQQEEGTANSAALTENGEHDARPFTVVIDAGHGGLDSGAVGVSGVAEKDITLAFARVLRDRLQRERGIYVYLTRDGDEFISLKKRVAIARDYMADLFISIHADHIDVNSLQGATIYTLSDKASDMVAKKLAEHENKADQVAGLPPDELPEVTDILIDLTRRETHAFSVRFADRVISALKKADIKLIRNPHRFAGFQVLRAPDIPSVLIELGYLSNVEDERLISKPAWREKMAELMTKSISSYAGLRQRETARH